MGKKLILICFSRIKNKLKTAAVLAQKINILHCDLNFFLIKICPMFQGLYVKGNHEETYGIH